MYTTLLHHFLGVLALSVLISFVVRELANRRNRFLDNGINFSSAGSGLLQDTNRDVEVTPIQEQLHQLQPQIDQKRLDKKQVMRSLSFMASGSNGILKQWCLHIWGRWMCSNQNWVGFESPTLEPL